MRKTIFPSDGPWFASPDVEIWLIVPYYVSHLYERARVGTRVAQANHEGGYQRLKAEIKAAISRMRDLDDHEPG